MKVQIAMVNSFGEIVCIFSPGAPSDYPDGGTFEQYTYRWLPNEVDMIDYPKTHYWHNGWNTREDRPSKNHYWKDYSWVLDSSALEESQRSTINLIRDSFRDDEVPATIGGQTVFFQHTSKDRENMKYAIEFFDVTHSTKANNKQLWKTVDNIALYFTKEELQNLYNTLALEKAKLWDEKFAYAEVKKSQLPLPEDDPVFNKLNW